ncbi:hypothetical protein, partial [Aquabacterium lacunae]|uniref:hypothetical protein n=1 Tax=Aquabacterium lacunae TaxID=2528630 RepID=UPI001A9350EB
SFGAGVLMFSPSRPIEVHPSNIDEVSAIAISLLHLDPSEIFFCNSHDAQIGELFNFLSD